MAKLSDSKIFGILESLGDHIIKSGVLKITDGGTSKNPAIEIGNSGAGFFINSGGEVVVVDEAGNTTTLT